MALGARSRIAGWKVVLAGHAGAEWQNGWRRRRFERTSSVSSVPSKGGGQNSGHGGSVFAPGAVFAFSDDFGRPPQELIR